MKIAIEGCCHGDLDKIYKLLDKDVKLLIICGDFQAIRTKNDLRYMNVPDKYKRLGDFHKYYSGQRTAPVPTIFIGGNHEDSHYLNQFEHGGYVAQNIYYMGRSSVVWFNGLRIGAISGIFKSHDFMQSHPEYDFNLNWAVRKAYHVRKDDYLNLRLLNPSKSMIMLSHDWPEGVYEYGDKKKLIKTKPFFGKDIKNHDLGNPYSWQLLNHIKPSNWFSAHLHVRFDATIDWKKRRLSEQLDNQDSKKLCIKPVVAANDDEIELDFTDDEEEEEEEEVKTVMEPVIEPKEEPTFNHSTRFLALDKCIRVKDCIQIIDVPVDESHFSYQKTNIFYDSEFISVIKTMPKYKEQINELTSDELMNLPVSLLQSIRNDIDSELERLNNKSKPDFAVAEFQPSVTSNGQEINPQTVYFKQTFLL